MAAITSYLRHHYGFTVVPKPRVAVTALEGGGLRNRRLKYATRVYEIRLEVWHNDTTDAAALDTFLATLKDGAVSCTWVSPDPADGQTYTCHLDAAAPVPRRLLSPGYWEWSIVFEATVL